MIVDTSAVIAILTAEDDAATYAHAIADASVRRLSAASYLECGSFSITSEIRLSAEASDEPLAEVADEFVVEPVTQHQAGWPVRPTQTSAEAAAIAPD